MRNTRRIRRMSRNRVKIGKMNLTSLMDVFTILVFFLLVNSGSVEVMEAPKTVVLPESNVETKPRETIVIFISPEEILVQGESVVQVADVLEAESMTVGPVSARLMEIGNTVLGPKTAEAIESQEVTILADRTVPFDVIRKIMSTCTEGGYENVSLAVIQKATLATTS